MKLIYLISKAIKGFYLFIHLFPLTFIFRDGIVEPQSQVLRYGRRGDYYTH